MLKQKIQYLLAWSDLQTPHPLYAGFSLPTSHLWQSADVGPANSQGPDSTLPNVAQIQLLFSQ